VAALFYPIENLERMCYNSNTTKRCGQDLITARVPDISAYKGIRQK
jgi:hypothetical protein